ncbi:hypothetical protein TNCT_451031, partial [Trichonephila clavata]
KLHIVLKVFLQYQQFQLALSSIIYHKNGNKFIRIM